MDELGPGMQIQVVTDPVASFPPVLRVRTDEAEVTLTLEQVAELAERAEEARVQYQQLRQLHRDRFDAMERGKRAVVRKARQARFQFRG